MELNGGELVIIRNSLVERKENHKEVNPKKYDELIKKFNLAIQEKTLKFYNGKKVWQMNEVNHVSEGIIYRVNEGLLFIGRGVILYM